MLAAEPKAASTAKVSSSTRESVWDSSTSARLAYSGARTTTPRPPSVRDTCTLGTSGSSTLLLGFAMATSMLRWPGMKVTEMVGKTDVAPDTVRTKMSAEAVRRTVMDAWGTDGTVASATRMKPVEEALSSVSSRLVTGADAPSRSCMVTAAWSLSTTVMATSVWARASPVKRGSALSSTCATVTPKEAPMSMSSSPMTTVTVTPVFQLDASRVTEAMAAPLALRSESWPAGRGAPLAVKEATGTTVTAERGSADRRTVYEAPWPPSVAAALTTAVCRPARSLSAMRTAMLPTAPAVKAWPSAPQLLPVTTMSERPAMWILPSASVSSTADTRMVPTPDTAAVRSRVAAPAELPDKAALLDTRPPSSSLSCLPATHCSLAALAVDEHPPQEPNTMLCPEPEEPVLQGRSKRSTPSQRQWPSAMKMETSVSARVVASAPDMHPDGMAATFTSTSATGVEALPVVSSTDGTMPEAV